MSTPSMSTRSSDSSDPLVNALQDLAKEMKEAIKLNADAAKLAAKATEKQALTPLPPGKFSGEKNDSALATQFLSQLENYLKGRPRASDEEKVIFAKSCLEGFAFQACIGCDTVDDIVRTLLLNCVTGTQALTGRTNLFNLCDRGVEAEGGLHKFLQSFKRTVSAIETIDKKPMDFPTVLAQLQRALGPDTAGKIALKNPTTLDETIQLVITLDSVKGTQQAHQPISLSQMEQHRHTPPTSSSSLYYTDPAAYYYYQQQQQQPAPEMEINAINFRDRQPRQQYRPPPQQRPPQQQQRQFRPQQQPQQYQPRPNQPLHRLTDQERQYLANNNGCFRCRQLGHHSRMCPQNQQPGHAWLNDRRQ
jgi:hypothetical protein